MKGRPPKPTETKRKTGNPGKRKLPDNTLTAGRGRPKPPATLTPAAVEIWNELIPQLEEAGTLDRADGIALEVLVTAVAIMRQAAEMLPKGNGTGLVIQQPSGRVAADPHFVVWQQAAGVARQFAEQFGLTPSARARLGMAGVTGRAPDADDDVPSSHRKMRVINGGK